MWLYSTLGDFGHQYQLIVDIQLGEMRFDRGAAIALARLLKHIFFFFLAFDALNGAVVGHADQQFAPLGVGESHECLGNLCAVTDPVFEIKLLALTLKYQCFRSEEHTSELQSLMRISYAVFCLKKKTTITYIVHVH